MAEHIAVDELADAAAGLVEAERAREIDTHVAACTLCGSRAATLAHVQAVLAADPVPDMPASSLA